jgi:hypothetical protein
VYKPKNQEKHEKKSIPREQAQVGGVILNFAQTRKTEAAARFRGFIKSPLAWIQENQPLRKAALLETLDYFRPAINAEYEHEIEKWKKSR